jgi:hypothetical protein
MAMLCSPSSGPCPLPVHYRPATPYISMLLTNHPHCIYTRKASSRGASSRLFDDWFAYGRVNGNVPARQPLPHV